jgi:hypothetical protein
MGSVLISVRTTTTTESPSEHNPQQSINLSADVGLARRSEDLSTLPLVAKEPLCRKSQKRKTSVLSISSDDVVQEPENLKDSSHEASEIAAVQKRARQSFLPAGKAKSEQMKSHEPGLSMKLDDTEIPLISTTVNDYIPRSTPSRPFDFHIYATGSETLLIHRLLYILT